MSARIAPLKTRPLHRPVECAVPGMRKSPPLRAGVRRLVGSVSPRSAGRSRPGGRLENSTIRLAAALVGRRRTPGGPGIGGVRKSASVPDRAEPLVSGEVERCPEVEPTSTARGMAPAARRSRAWVFDAVRGVIPRRYARCRRSQLCVTSANIKKLAPCREHQRRAG